MEALLALIKEEVALYRSHEEIIRPTFGLRDMSALEAQLFREKRESLINMRLNEQRKKQKMVLDYRMTLTDSIMENCPDVGVTGKMD